MKQFIKKCIVKLRNEIKKHPKLKNKIINILNISPSLKIKLKSLAVKKANYTEWEASSKKPQLLVDITNVHQEDLKTGIQRVVRAILKYLEVKKIDNLDLQPIYLTDEDGYWCYKYVKSLKTIVVPKKGDIFLGLDCNLMISVLDEAGMFQDWKDREIELNFILYDMLPINFPHYWTYYARLVHTLWFNTIIKYSTKIMCISQAVSKEVKQYIHTNRSKFSNIPQIEWFHLGADIENSQPSIGIPSDAQELAEKLANTKSFLMVSTIEPRKGHKQTFKAFEQLWDNGVNVSLVIVGKIGWMMEEFKNNLNKHPQRNKKLFWLEGISDEYLNIIYQSSTCLIAASEGEGFGLPLIEAAQHKKPIIARDIPVFREVAGDFAYYFENNNNPEVIEKSIIEWLELYKNGTHPKSDSMKWLTWEESTMQLTHKGLE